jgi:RNA-directed DNA polymerase
MSGPGERASKIPSPGEPTHSKLSEGNSDVPIKVDLERSLSPGSMTSARSDMLPARKPGDLGGASPLQHDGRQSREGTQADAVVEAAEESDAVVVPGKSTKTRVTPVESVEGRTAAKGKSAARNALRAQDRQSALTYLQRIGQRAKQKPKERFTNLLSQVKVPLLKEAYQRLKRHAATGVDGVSWHEYGARLDERLLELQDRIHRGSYHPLPVRRVHIPKGDGRTRPLGIAALEDKVVQQAVRMVIEPIYEAEFVGFSYGFRPKRSAHDALDALAEAIMRRVNWVLDADIRSFFDSVDHEWMQRFIEHRIGDKRMVRLLMKWVRAGAMEDGKLYDVEKGTPQGAIISPLLSNIYLHYVLDLWVCHWRKKHALGEVYVVRYADDFVVGLQREQDALAIREALAERLGQFGLELHPDKTRVLRFGRFAREDCEQHGLGKPDTFEFLGFTHIAGKRRRGTFLLLRRTSRKKRQASQNRIARECKRRRHWSLHDQYRWLSSVLVGHYRYYGVPTNMRALRQFRQVVRLNWVRWLQRRSQRARWHLEQYRAFEKRFPLPTAQIFHPWPEKRFADR